VKAAELSCLIYSTLKMEAICSSETSVDFQRTTRPYILEDTTLHNHRRENLKTHTARNVAIVLYYEYKTFHTNLYGIKRM
jgi:hypothetical protein